MRPRGLKLSIRRVSVFSLACLPADEIVEFPAYRGEMERARVLLGLLALTAAAAACTTADPAAAPTTSPSAGPTTAASASRTGGTPATSPAADREPLVIAVHATRVPPALDLAAARALVAARRTADPARAIRTVEADPRAIAVVPASAVGPTVRVATVAGVHPLREPARYPLTTPAPTRAAPPGPVLMVTIGGDVMLGRRVGAAAARTGDPVAPLRALSARLAAADLTVLNLESTMSRAGVPRQGNDSFAAPPAVAAGLRSLGVDVVSLANNHTGDFGTRALLDTVTGARRAGLATVGAGSNSTEAWRPVIVTRGGVRFGFLAFNAIGETPRATATAPGSAEVRMPPRTGPLNRADVDALSTAVRNLRRAADVVVVLPHWGAQYTHRPHPAQRTVARAALAAGADLVVGGHPHWVQGIDAVGNKLVVHSLGNLVFDMDFAIQTQRGMLLELTYWGSVLKAAELVPYRIGPDFAPRVVTGATATAILAPVWANSTGAFRP